jgi:hypothetical protein
MEDRAPVEINPSGPPRGHCRQGRPSAPALLILGSACNAQSATLRVWSPGQRPGVGPCAGYAYHPPVFWANLAFGLSPLLKFQAVLFVVVTDQVLGRVFGLPANLGERPAVWRRCRRSVARITARFLASDVFRRKPHLNRRRACFRLTKPFSARPKRNAMSRTINAEPFARCTAILSEIGLFSVIHFPEAAT